MRRPLAQLSDRSPLRVDRTLAARRATSSLTRRIAGSRGFVARVLRSFALIGALAGAFPASAQDGAHGLGSWLLYGGPEIGAYGHSAKATSTSTPLTGPRVGNPNTTLGDLGTLVSDQQRSRELVMGFLAGATFGGLTPALDVPGRPRLFIDINISVPQTTEAQLARRGNPGQISFPRLPDDVEHGSPFGEGTLSGVGTQITAQLQGPQIHAGFGPSFEFPLPGDQLIRIKPAVMYSRTILDLKAQTRRAVRLNGQFGAQQGLEDFRFILLSDERTEVYHAIGPSFEFEYDPGLQWGPFGVTLYARGHASHFLTSLKTEMEQCNIAGGQPNECARYKYTQDPWAYRATAGVHVTWIPRLFW
jgi:hypothetical protein